MNRIAHTVLGAAVASLAACVSVVDPYEMSTRSAEELEKTDARELCHAFARSGAANLRDEIVRRELITDAGWQMVEEGRIELGMSECALQATNQCSEVVGASEDHGAVNQYVCGKKRFWAQAVGGVVVSVGNE